MKFTFPQMVATDIDGTLVPYNGTISERTRSALHNCLDENLDVVLVTGRPPRWMPPIVEATGLSTTAICANGAVAINMQDLDILAISTIEPGIAKEMISILLRAVPDAVFGAETPTRLRAGPGYEELRNSGVRSEGLAPRERTVTTTNSIEAMLDDARIFKISMISPSSTADDLLEIARSEVSPLAHVTRSTVGRALIELGPRGVTKASALAAYAASRGVEPADVIAFGDMPNDLEMLTWAGRGYAMDGGHPEAVAAAPYSAPGAAADGVAQVLERMLAYRVMV